MDQISSIAQLLEHGSLVTGLVFVLCGGAKGWWVFGNAYREMKQERDEWKSLAMQNLNLLDKATDKTK